MDIYGYVYKDNSETFRDEDILNYEEGYELMKFDFPHGLNATPREVVDYMPISLEEEEIFWACLFIRNDDGGVDVFAYDSEGTGFHVLRNAIHSMHVNPDGSLKESGLNASKHLIRAALYLSAP